MTTLVTFLLDKSGSMLGVRDETIEAYNAYADGLRQGQDISFSLLQFDSVAIETTCKKTPAKDIPHLSYDNFQPRASTPLIDACVKTIKAVEKIAQPDDKVVICFQTDGYENASREHTWGELNDLVKEKTLAGWQFNFLGAGIDAYAQARAMGINAMSAMSYDHTDRDATRAAFTASATNVTDWSLGIRENTHYTAEQRMQAGDRFGPRFIMVEKKTEAAATAKPNASIVDEPEL